MEQLVKRRLFCFVCLLFCLSILLISSSYAMQDTKKVDVNKINSNTLQVIYENEDQMLKNSVYPMTFQQGKETSPSNIIKIVNKSDFSTKIFLTLSQVDVHSNDLDMGKLYYTIGNTEIVRRLNGDIDEVIYEKKLAPHEIIEIDLKLWVGADLVEYSDQGKSIRLQFKVIEQ